MSFTGGLSKKQYDDLREFFQAFGVNFAKAARALNIDPRTAKRAWSTGWPAAGLAPISVSMGGLAKESPPTKLADNPPTVLAVESESTAERLSPDSGAASATVSQTPQTSDNALSQPDVIAVNKALALLDDARAAAIKKDLAILESVGSNAQGIQVISTRLLAGLNDVVPQVLEILTRDAKDGLAMSAQAFVTTLEKIVKISSEGTKVLAAYRDGLQAVGQVTANKDRDSSKGAITIEGDDDAVGGLRMLGTFIAANTKRTTARRGSYGGEEGGAVIDVPVSPAKQIAPADGKAVANEPAASPISAQPLE